VVGFSIVTIGDEASRQTAKLFEAGDFTKYLYLHGLSVETAEALAELAHKQAREFLGIAGEDSQLVTDLFHQKYRGSRYSFGYPACPNLEDQTKIFRLLKPERTSACGSPSSFHLEPEQSTNCRRGASSPGQVFCGVAVCGISRVLKGHGFSRAVNG
jgi:5-methyltetrahydrofolate--homocysteine methyltransferase